MLNALERNAKENTSFRNLNSMVSRFEGAKPFTAEEEAELQAEFNALPENTNTNRTGAGATSGFNVREIENFLAGLEGGKRKTRKASRRRSSRRRY